MDYILPILAFLFVVVGIIGCVVPIIPGVVLAWVGLLCSFFCSFSQISTAALWIYLLLTVVVSLADYFLPAYMSRLFGGTRAGMRGATAGMIIGMLVGGVVGVVAGPFIGAVAGEMIHDGSDFVKALKVGCGSFLSFIVGTGMKLALSVAMLVQVWHDIYTPLREWAATLF